MKYLALAVLLVSSFASADVIISAGVGKNIMKQNGTPFERAAIMGYQFKLPKSVFVRPQVGYFADFTGQGVSSAWGAVLVGVEARSPVGPVLHLAVGPAYLQNPDQVLGGHFQFNLEGGIGLCDDNVCVKLVLDHLSSGSINMPNLGRDLIMVQTCILAF